MLIWFVHYDENYYSFAKNADDNVYDAVVMARPLREITRFI